jgi:MinD-like ATPase involved in chromosome partitioning or flagellar assembly
MTDTRNGQVVTFYSYKGGTGRTMALANVAWILAANGKRVLVVDWDLESPGLFRFFRPFISPSALASARGVIELIQEYEWANANGAAPPDSIERHASVTKYSFSLQWNAFPGEGTIDYLAAGQQNHNYATTLAATSWDDFYEHCSGGEFFDALRDDMKRNYDYTLIDSRTGLSDVADICTKQLPDQLVSCFTLSDQGIEGAAEVARTVSEDYRRRNIRILPVAMRVDPAEKQKAEAGQSVAMQQFAGLPADMSEIERQRYWNSVQVPYQAFYAYEETLATFGDVQGSSGTLLNAYEVLTRYLTNGAVTALPPIDTAIRKQINARFERRPTAVQDTVVLRYTARDQVWAEWIEYVLTAAGLRVILEVSPDDSDGEAKAADPDEVPLNARKIRIISRYNAVEESATTCRSPSRSSQRGFQSRSRSSASWRWLTARRPTRRRCSATDRGSPATMPRSSTFRRATQSSPAGKATSGSCGPIFARVGRSCSTASSRPLCKACRSRCKVWAGSGRRSSRSNTRTVSAPPTTSCGG